MITISIMILMMMMETCRQITGVVEELLMASRVLTLSVGSISWAGRRRHNNFRPREMSIWTIICISSSFGFGSLIRMLQEETAGISYDSQFFHQFNLCHSLCVCHCVGPPPQVVRMRTSHKRGVDRLRGEGQTRASAPSAGQHCCLVCRFSRDPQLKKQQTGGSKQLSSHKAKLFD